MTSRPPDGSYQHLYFNVNKRSLVLDWRTDDGMERLLGLAESADILIETNQPGEFPVERVREANPHLIVVSATPYGQRGPKSGWRATDLTATAAGGLLQVSGERDDPTGAWRGVSGSHDDGADHRLLGDDGAAWT